MNEDLSNGWEASAEDFISGRSRNIGAATVKEWSKSFAKGQHLLDVGCGFGGSYTQNLIDRSITVHGIDASGSLIAEHQRRFPTALTRHEAAEQSDFFAQQYDGILSVGFMFLLSPANQERVLSKMAGVLKENGKLLFSSPYQICEWNDLLTGRKSVSLGRDRYIGIMEKHGLSLIDEYTDEGNSHYYNFCKPTSD